MYAFAAFGGGQARYGSGYSLLSTGRKLPSYTWSVPGTLSHGEPLDVTAFRQTQALVSWVEFQAPAMSTGVTSSASLSATATLATAQTVAAGSTLSAAASLAATSGPAAATATSATSTLATTQAVGASGVETSAASEITAVSLGVTSALLAAVGSLTTAQGVSNATATAGSATSSTTQAVAATAALAATGVVTSIGGATAAATLSAATSQSTAQGVAATETSIAAVTDTTAVTLGVTSAILASSATLVCQAAVAAGSTFSSSGSLTAADNPATTTSTSAQESLVSAQGVAAGSSLACSANLTASTGYLAGLSASAVLSTAQAVAAAATEIAATSDTTAVALGTTTGVLSTTPVLLTTQAVAVDETLSTAGALAAGTGSNVQSAAQANLSTAQGVAAQQAEQATLTLVTAAGSASSDPLLVSTSALQATDGVACAASLSSTTSLLCIPLTSYTASCAALTDLQTGVGVATDLSVAALAVLDAELPVPPSPGQSVANTAFGFATSVSSGGFTKQAGQYLDTQFPLPVRATADAELDTTLVGSALATISAPAATMAVAYGRLRLPVAGSFATFSAGTILATGDAEFATDGDTDLTVIQPELIAEVASDLEAISLDSAAIAGRRPPPVMVLVGAALPGVFCMAGALTGAPPELVLQADTPLDQPQSQALTYVHLDALVAVGSASVPDVASHADAAAILTGECVVDTALPMLVGSGVVMVQSTWPSMRTSEHAGSLAGVEAYSHGYVEPAACVAYAVGISPSVVAFSIAESFLDNDDAEALWLLGLSPQTFWLSGLLPQDDLVGIS